MRVIAIQDRLVAGRLRIVLAERLLIDRPHRNGRRVDSDCRDTHRFDQPVRDQTVNDPIYLERLVVDITADVLQRSLSVDEEEDLPFVE